MEISFKLRGWSRVWFIVCCQVVPLVSVYGQSVSPQYIFNPSQSLEFSTCDVKYAGVCAVQVAIGLIGSSINAACASLSETNTEKLGLSYLQSGILVNNMPGKHIGTFVLERSTGKRLVDTWVPGAVDALLDDKAVYGVVSQPTLLSEFQTAVDDGGGWVAHQWRWSAGGVAVPVLSYVKKCSVDKGHIIGTTIGREPLPASENSPPTFISMGGLKNAQRLVGMLTTDILAARTFVDMERVWHDIVYTPKYHAGGGWYVFMTKVGDKVSTDLEIIGDSGGVSVAHGKLPALIGLNSSTYRKNKGFPQPIIDQGHTLYVSQASAAVTGGRWNDYTWGPLDNLYYKISLVVGVWINGQKYYLGSGFKMVAAPTTSGPNSETCSALSNNGCAATNSLTLLSSALAMALTKKPEHDLWQYISHGYSDDYTDLFFNMSGGFFVFVFDYDGTCVADASEPSNIGKPLWQLTPPGIDSTALHSKFIAAADTGGMWVKYPWRSSTASYNKLAYITKMYKYSKQFYMGVAFADVTPPIDAQCSALYAEPCAEYSVQRMVGAANAALLGAASAAETSVILQNIATSTSTGGFAVRPYDENFECPAALKNSNPAHCPPEISAHEKIALMTTLTKTSNGGWATLDSRTPGGHGNATYVHPVNANFANIILYSSVINNNAPKCTGACPSHSTCISGRCLCDPGWRPSYSNTGVGGTLTVKTMTCVDKSMSLCTIAGMGIFGKLGICQSCTAGRYKSGTSIKELSPCSPCPAGEISNTIGATACTYCTAGKYSDLSGSSLCKRCPAGTYAPGIGKTSCLSCPPGSYSEQENSASCKECSQGKYQPSNSSTACHRCPGTMETTLVIGSASLTACVCEKSSYRPRGGTPGSECKGCPEGMRCDVGSGEDALLNASSQNLTKPLLMPGYWSSIAQPMMTFSCVDDTEDSACRGGVPPGCTGGLIGTVCSQCPHGYKVDGAECDACDGWEFTIALFFLAVLLIAPIMLMRLLVPTHTWRINAMQTVGMTCEVLVEIGQTMASVTSLRITWPPAVDFGLQFFEGLPFKVYIFDPVSAFDCFGTKAFKSDFTKYFGMAVLIPGIAGYMCAIYPICSRWLPERWRWDFHTTAHVILKFVNLVFISQVFISMAPFQCYSHPSGNPKTSVQSFAATFCETAEHAALLVVGLMSVGFCVGFFAYLVWETRQFKKKFTSRCDPEALTLYIRRVTFILEDFKLETYYWNLISKALEFLIGGIFIAIIPSSTRAQVFVYIFVFTTCIFLWSTFTPFKIPLLNLAISLICGVLLWILVLATTQLPDATNFDKDVTSAFLSTFMCLEFLLFVVLISVASITLYYRGSRGKLLTISLMATTPDDKEILERWERARKLQVAQLRHLLSSWQSHELAELASILLKFEAFQIGKRSSQLMSFLVIDPKFDFTDENVNSVCKRWHKEKEELDEIAEEDETVAPMDDSLADEASEDTHRYTVMKESQCVHTVMKESFLQSQELHGSSTQQVVVNATRKDVGVNNPFVVSQVLHQTTDASPNAKPQRPQMAVKSQTQEQTTNAKPQRPQLAVKSQTQVMDSKVMYKAAEEKKQGAGVKALHQNASAKRPKFSPRGTQKSVGAKKQPGDSKVTHKVAELKKQGAVVKAMHQHADAKRPKLAPQGTQKSVGTKKQQTASAADNDGAMKHTLASNGLHDSADAVQLESSPEVALEPLEVQNEPDLTPKAVHSLGGVKKPKRFVKGTRYQTADAKLQKMSPQGTLGAIDFGKQRTEPGNAAASSNHTMVLNDLNENTAECPQLSPEKPHQTAEVKKQQSPNALKTTAAVSTAAVVLKGSHQRANAQRPLQAEAGTYIVQFNGGLAVHATSNWTVGPKVAELSYGTKVEALEYVVFKDRVRARIASPVGWISIMSTNGSQEFAVKVLGTYIVQLKGGMAVHTTSNWKLGTKVAELPYGTIVEALELGNFKNRVRARIASPAGWISIKCTDGSQEFAVKADLNERDASSKLQERDMNPTYTAASQGQEHAKGPMELRAAANMDDADQRGTDDFEKHCVHRITAAEEAKLEY